MKNKLKTIAMMIIKEFFTHFFFNIAALAYAFHSYEIAFVFLMAAFYDRIYKIEKAMACSPKSVTVNIDHGSDEVAMRRELGVKG